MASHAREAKPSTPSMELTDLSKDIRRLLLDHWTEGEINAHLQNPGYFFEQLVMPRLDYLRRNGEEIPQLRIQKLLSGKLRIFLRT